MSFVVNVRWFRAPMVRDLDNMCQVQPQCSLSPVGAFPPSSDHRIL
jgi:hypothetical protein